MVYSVKEIFKTLQGEGSQAGRTAVFCRFSGCNLWSGREQDRAGAQCTFCDTDFVGTNGTDGGKYASAQVLAATLARVWGPGKENRFVVFTGGEPLLQLEAALVSAVHEQGFEIALETNGTLPAPEGIDWICVSPKAGNTLVQTRGNELKLVYPQPGIHPSQFEHLDFQQFWLQPMDNPLQRANTEQAIAYCLEHPRWRLSTQTHKMIGIR